MDKISFRNYCDKNYKGPADPFFRLCSHGAATFCGVAYPTEDSRSCAACEKTLDIGSSSFLRRPSLCDEAVNTISGFINEGLYALQDPGKPFFCSTAILYIYRSKARWMVSGNAAVFHFQNGRLIQKSTDSREPLLGKHIRWEPQAEPDFDISHGSNAFVLCSATESDDFADRISEVGSHLMNGDGTLAESSLSVLHGTHCSAAVLLLPERKGKWFRRNK